MRNHAQELRELGIAGTTSRLAWEAYTRAASLEHRWVGTHWSPPQVPEHIVARMVAKLQFGDFARVVECVRPLASHRDMDQLKQHAQGACEGRIWAFSCRYFEYGLPIDWFLNPQTGVRWNPSALWSDPLLGSTPNGDIKMSWELGRFPHAYHLARAAAYFPDQRDRYADTVASQIADFVIQNPAPMSVHWSSGQEIAIRLLSWLFSQHSLIAGHPRAAGVAQVIADSLAAAAHHLKRTIFYAEHAVYNNHLLAEALGLYVAGSLLEGLPEAPRWKSQGEQMLTREMKRQFYTDGGYIQLSHNYHRLALQLMIWACWVARVCGDDPRPEWIHAMDRSLHFLYQQQNPADGRLPNYGPNDGALATPLSFCDYADFRPTLQYLAVLCRGERMYEPGPWDELSLWFDGPSVYDLPLAKAPRTHVSFTQTGFHVLRGADEHTFVTFRCGSIPDRFGQPDLLHVDVFYKGMNVCTDPGTYSYSEPKWNRHFGSTASHNTVTVDGRDQMVQHRQFKYLYRAKAKWIASGSCGGVRWVIGEHYGFQRHAGGCVHRRAVLLADPLLVVFDRVEGQGRHAVRLHWLLGDFPADHDTISHRVRLSTPEGGWHLSVFDQHASVVPMSMVRGQEEPPRGWLSRYYSYKVAVGSVAVEVDQEVPVDLVTVQGPGAVRLQRDGDFYEAESAGQTVRFILRGDRVVIA
jgi:hypothetical protein